jgi:hypothetical protein
MPIIAWAATVSVISETPVGIIAAAAAAVRLNDARRERKQRAGEKQT